jgi:hypothetical protein
MKTLRAVNSLSPFQSRAIPRTVLRQALQARIYQSDDITVSTAREAGGPSGYAAMIDDSATLINRQTAFRLVCYRGQY